MTKYLAWSFAAAMVVFSSLMGCKNRAEYFPTVSSGSYLDRTMDVFVPTPTPLMTPFESVAVQAGIQKIEMSGNTLTVSSVINRSISPQDQSSANQTSCAFVIKSASGGAIDVDDCLRVSVLSDGVSGVEHVWFESCDNTSSIRIVGKPNDVLRISMWDVSCCGCGHNGFMITNLGTSTWSKLLEPSFCNPEYPELTTCSVGASGGVPCCPECGVESAKKVIFLKRIGDIMSSDGGNLLCNPPTFTLTATPSVSEMATPIETETPTPDLILTETHTETETPSPSVAWTATFTPSFTVSASATETYTPTIALSATYTAGTTTQTKTPVLTITPTAIVSVTRTPTCPAGSYRVDATDYAQANPTWAKTPLDHSTDTIGSRGCFLTSFSILSGVNPGVLNRTFTDSDPAAISETGALDSVQAARLVGWTALERVAYSEGNLEASLNADVSLRVIVEVQNGLNHHFVVVTGEEWDSITGRCRFTIEDPGYRNKKYLDEYTNCLSIRRFE
jgi:hypothetical protein